MDAWLRNLVKTVSGASSSSREPEILLCKRVSSSTATATRTVVAPSTSARAPLQAPTTSTPTPTTANRCSSPSRIAHWDNKREKCRNCKLIYLKTLSRHPGYCSVDCKSNAAYLHKVNRTIRAMKDAVEQQQQQQQQQQQEEAAAKAVVTVDTQSTIVAAAVTAEEEVEDCNESEQTSRATANTFSEFGLESRILDASNVEWAFSALY